MRKTAPTRFNTPRATKRLAALLLVFAVSGCAATAWLDEPSRLPEQWSGRRRFNTRNTVIYACSERAAAEADRLAADVAEGFEKETGGKASKGLLIVTDAGDEPVVTNLRDLHRLLAKSATANPHGKLSSGLEETRRDIQRHNIQPKTILVVTPVPIEKADLRGCLGFPDPLPGSVTWIAAIPTRAAIRRSNKTIIKSFLEKEGIGPITQIILAPAIFVAEESMLDIAAAARDVVLFERFAMTQHDWPLKEKRRRAFVYAKRRKKEAMGLLALLRKKEKAVKKTKSR